jgi:hypothetical protein
MKEVYKALITGATFLIKYLLFLGVLLILIMLPGYVLTTMLKPETVFLIYVFGLTFIFMSYSIGKSIMGDRKAEEDKKVREQLYQQQSSEYFKALITKHQNERR